MAADLLLLEPDEVARNGAFWKILRPEVFPDAPLQFPFGRALRWVPRQPSPEATADLTERERAECSFVRTISPAICNLLVEIYTPSTSVCRA
jgi:hypothetical protein